jgi:hypothetical protein
MPCLRLLQADTWVMPGAQDDQRPFEARAGPAISLQGHGGLMLGPNADCKEVACLDFSKDMTKDQFQEFWADRLASQSVCVAMLVRSSARLARCIALPETFH